MMVPWEEHTKVSVFMWYKSNCKETFYRLFLDDAERERKMVHICSIFCTST